MQKSSFFTENEGEKGILDGYLFWSHKTCCATKKGIAPESPRYHNGFGVFSCPNCGVQTKRYFSLPGGLELPTPTISGGF